MNKAQIHFVVAIAVICSFYVSPANASQDTIGPNGIRSAGLMNFAKTAELTGDGIAIGQVEALRAGKTGHDTSMDCCNSFIVPEDVFFLDMQANPNQGLSAVFHAHWVAGVMISTDTVIRGDNGFPATGVAIEAKLYASASAGGNDFQSDAAISAQHLTTVADIRATNFSFGTPFHDGHSSLDGDSLLTLFVDWSAFQHNVLYVVAGNEGSSLPIPVPTDNFNGMTVAFSAKNDTDDVFRDVSLLNNFTKGTGNRVLIDILAPGAQIDLVGPNNSAPTGALRTGTSYAAPHVTGTVALLQQYGDERIMAGASGWNTNAQRHEVMKTVLMNSADKIKDDGELAPLGSLLGMDRTVLDAQAEVDPIVWAPDRVE